jgi:hypothetical protein
VTNAKNTTDSINEDFRKLASKIESAHGLQIEETKVDKLPEKLL